MVPDSGLVSCRWNFTNTATNETQVLNGTCASPGSKSAGPWCYVEPNTCKHQPLKDQTGQSYDNCATNTSTHTLDTCKCHTVLTCTCSLLLKDTALRAGRALLCRLGVACTMGH